MTTYLATLAVTMVVETFVALALVPERRGLMVVVAPLASLLTHPLATLALRQGGWNLYVVEGLVVVVEAAVYAVVAGLGARRAFLVSVAANGVTLAIGLVWRMG